MITNEDYNQLMSDDNTKGIDCSAFITWVLIQYGYTEFIEQTQLSTNDFICWILDQPGANYDLSQYGWEWTTTETETPQPGDFLLKVSESPHIEVFAGDGVGTYGAGTLEQIRKEISYSNCSTSRIIDSGDFRYIIRVTKK